MENHHDELYAVLSNAQRRHLLFALLETNPQTQVPSNLDTPPDTALTDGTARIEYHHVHLPKLADSDFIEWSPGTDNVERGPRFDEIEPTLELLAEHHGYPRNNEPLQK